MLNSATLRGLFGFIFGCVGLLFFITATSLIFLLVESIFDPSSASHEKSTHIRNYGIAVTAIIGFPFLVWRSIIADKQVKVSETSHFDEKVNASAQALSSQREYTVVNQTNGGSVLERHLEDNVVARVAAITNLESLARERPSSARNTIALLAAYVSGTFPAENLEPSEDITTRRIPRADLQRAIDAIGNLSVIARTADPSEWRIDLSRSNLDGVNFSSGDFYAANLSRCRCEGAIFRSANFEGALFYGTLLNHGDFFKTNLRGARLDFCILNEPQPVRGGMAESVNFAILHGTTFIGADIGAVDYLGGTEAISKTMGSSDTLVAEELKREMPANNIHKSGYLSFRVQSRGKPINPKNEEALNKLKDTGFQYWQPYPSSDGATGWNVSKFLKAHGLQGWPYTG